jgi:hypothetical protein
MAGLKQVVLGAAVVLSGGCYSGIGEADHTDEMAQMRELQFNTVVLNTARFNSVKFNTFRFNSFRFNSVRFNSVRFNSVRFNSVKFNSIDLDGSEFVGVLEGEDLERRGADLIGTEIELTIYAKNDKNVEVSENVTMRFDDIYLDPEAPGGDVWLYDITYKMAGSDEWSPICETGAPVVPMHNYWDEVTGDSHRRRGSVSRFRAPTR